MKKKVIVISEWISKKDFKQMKSNVEDKISDVESFFYLACVNHPKKIEELPKIKNTYYLSKKDFTLFGKVKTPILRELLIKENGNILIVAFEKETALLKKVLKSSKLMNIGIEKKTLPIFDVSFRDSQLTGGKLFNQINNYLTKIQL